MDQTASTSALDHAAVRRHERRSQAGNNEPESIAQPPDREAPAAPELGAREPSAKGRSWAALEADIQQASHLYTGLMLWAACLFIAAGAVLTSVGRFGTAVGLVALVFLAGAVVVQYIARRRLRQALVARATAKGASKATALADAEATLERITR